jgi:hypothetical protein
MSSFAVLRPDFSGVVGCPQEGGEPLARWIEHVFD